MRVLHYLLMGLPSVPLKLLLEVHGFSKWTAILLAVAATVAWWILTEMTAAHRRKKYQ